MSQVPGDPHHTGWRGLTTAGARSMVCLCNSACFAGVALFDPFNTPMMEYLYVNGMIFILFEPGGGKNQYPLSVKGGFMFG